MKKIFTLTAILLLVAMFATVFVGCDKKEEEQNITADTKFEDIVSDKITEEELISMVQDAKNVDNYRVNRILYDDSYVVQSLVEIKGYTLKQVEKIIEVLDEDFEDDINAVAYTYSYIENNIKYLLFSRDNKNWEVNQSEIVDVNGNNMYAILLEGYYAYYRELDGAEGVGVKWSDEYKAYVYGDGDGNDWVYKFKNNRMCAFAIYNEDKSFNQTSIFYDFGKVPEITLPEISE